MTIKTIDFNKATFPNLCTFYYGTLNLSAVTTKLAQFNLIVLGLDATSPANTATQIASIKAINPNAKVLVYLNYSELSSSNSAHPTAVLQKVATQNWYHKSISGTYLGGYLTAWGTNVTTAATPDSSGNYYPNWYAKYMMENWVLPSNADGVFVDVFNPVMSVSYQSSVVHTNAGTVSFTANSITDTGKAWTVDENQNRMIAITAGTGAGQTNWLLTHAAGNTISTKFNWITLPDSTSTYQIYTWTALASQYAASSNLLLDGIRRSTDSVAAALAIQQGNALAINQIRASAITAGKPGFIVTANYGPGANRINITRGLLDGIVYEGVTGAFYSKPWATAYGVYAECIRESGDYPIELASINNTTDYTNGRYGYAAGLMQNGWHSISNGVNSPMVLDEYPFLLGLPTDNQQYTAWSNGVWRRRFENGMALFNPTASSQTVSCPGYKRITGTQSSTVNDGSSAASCTLPAGTGLILIPNSTVPLSIAPVTSVETGAGSGDYVGTPYIGSDTILRFGSVVDPANSSLTCWKHTVRQGDPLIWGGYRSEITYTPSDYYIQNGSEYWMAFEIYIPNTWPLVRTFSDRSLFFQVHQRSDAADTENTVPLSLYQQEDGYFRWQISSSPLKISSDADTIRTELFVEPIQTNTWIKYIVRYRPHYDVTQSPILQIWRNGIQIISSTAPNAFNNDLPAWPKMGIYKWGTPWTVTQYDMYSKGMYFGAGSGLFNNARLALP